MAFRAHRELHSNTSHVRNTCFRYQKCKRNCTSRFSCALWTTISVNNASWNQKQLPREMFCTVIVIASYPLINLARPQRVALSSLPDLEFIHNKINGSASYPEAHFNPDSVKAVPLKLVPDRHQQMHQHRSVQKNGGSRLNNYLQKNVMNADRYERRRHWFLEMVK